MSVDTTQDNGQITKGEGELVRRTTKCDSKESCLAYFQVIFIEWFYLSYCLQYREGEEIKCYYKEGEREVRETMYNFTYTATKVWLFCVVTLFMCIPCCFLGGFFLIWVGVSEQRLDFFNRVRCDNTFLPTDQSSKKSFFATPEINEKLL